MKPNIKLLVSILCIILLSAYILLSGRHGKNGPKLEPWDEEPDYVLIQRSSDLIYFRKENGVWYINDAKYPADAEAVTNFTDKIKNLVITDLISEQPYYARYGLTPEKEMTITIKAGNEILQRISVGSRGATGRHTFIRIGDRQEVYQADILFSDEDMSVEAYRDMKVCKIPAADICDLTVVFGGKSFDFHKALPKDKDEEEENREEESNKSTATEEDGLWESPQASENKLDTQKVMSFITSIANLRASGFAEKALIRQSEKKASVLVKAYDDTETSFDIFLYNEKEKLYAVEVSDSKYPFTLEEWAVKKFFLEDISQYFATEK